jgi:uncharacterized protein
VDEDALGRGLAVPLGLGRTGLAQAAGVAKVEQAIRVLVGTLPGQRIMRPDYGCALGTLAFAPNSTSTADLARYYVTDALARWEPRVEVVDVAVANDAVLGRLVIDVRYRLRATREVRRLVHPFALEGPR